MKTLENLKYEFDKGTEVKNEIERTQEELLRRNPQLSKDAAFLHAVKQAEAKGLDLTLYYKDASETEYVKAKAAAEKKDMGNEKNLSEFRRAYIENTNITLLQQRQEEIMKRSPRLSKPEAWLQARQELLNEKLLME